MKLNIIIITGLLIFSSCAHLEKEWIASNCNVNAAFEQGFNDNEASKEMDSSAFTLCLKDEREKLKKSYSAGYAKSSQQKRKDAPKVVKIEIVKKSYFCKLEVFSKTYTSFGPTKLEALNATTGKCKKDEGNNSIFCEDKSVKCQINK